MQSLLGLLSFRFSGRVYEARLVRHMGEPHHVLFWLPGGPKLVLYRTTETRGTDEPWWSPRSERLSPLERAALEACGAPS